MIEGNMKEMVMLVWSWIEWGRENRSLLLLDQAKGFEQAPNFPGILRATKLRASYQSQSSFYLLDKPVSVINSKRQLLSKENIDNLVVLNSAICFINCLITIYITSELNKIKQGPFFLKTDSRILQFTVLYLFFIKVFHEYFKMNEDQRTFLK